MPEGKTEVEAFIEREAHIPEFLERVMLADDPVMAQFQSVGGLAGIRKVHELRERVVTTYGFAVLTREVVSRLTAYAPFVEVGAGTGYWSYELQRAGCVSVASDVYVSGKSVPNFRYPYRRRLCFGDVCALSAPDAVRMHPDKTLLMVWPETGEEWSYEALAAYQGETLIYVGAIKRGRPTDDRFHDEIEQSWILKERIKIPRFPGEHDALFAYSRA